MILAVQDKTISPLAWAIITSVVLVIGFGALLCFRYFDRKAKASLQRIYEEVGVTEQPLPDGVHIVFHTYYGFFTSFIQIEHRAVLPLEKAEEFLRRLHRFNMTWGFFAYGAIIIPLMSYGNYLAQLKKIRAEHRANFINSVQRTDEDVRR